VEYIAAEAHPNVFLLNVFLVYEWLLPF